jgi:hypothetical protein
MVATPTLLYWMCDKSTSLTSKALRSAPTVALDRASLVSRGDALLDEDVSPQTVLELLSRIATREAFASMQISDVVRASLLCCAVLCCAVLCCAVLCCAVLCCAVLCCAVLCCAVVWCGVVWCGVVLCSVETW